MNTTIVLATALLTGFAINSSGAAIIRLQPLGPVVTAGSTFQVELGISGLRFATPPSLGAFDLDLTYDPGILHFSGFSLGDPDLGDQLDLGGPGSVSSVDSSVGGLVNLFEVSLNTPEDLDNLQPDAFRLGVFTFTALGPGSSSLNLAINALGDSMGDPLPASVLSASVTVGAAIAVPERMGTAGSLAFAAIALFSARLRRRRW